MTGFGMFLLKRASLAFRSVLFEMIETYQETESFGHGTEARKLPNTSLCHASQHSNNRGQGDEETEESL